MIREYAIEPELLLEWVTKQGPHAHMLRDGFGVGTPRLLSRYPPHQRKLLSAQWQIAIETREASATTDVAREDAQTFKVKCHIVLEQLMLYWLSREGIVWDPSKNWLDNALEHWPEPLQTIVVRHHEGAPLHVLHEGTLFSEIAPSGTFPGAGSSPVTRLLWQK